MRFTEKYLDSEEFVLYSTSGANIIEIPDIVEGHKYGGQAINKFGQLEDIEQELGIDLITLFKAFSQGSSGFVYMFVKNDYNEEYKKGLIKPLIITSLFRYANTKEYRLGLYDSLTCKNYIVSCKDYGKTWASTKEELE